MQDRLGRRRLRLKSGCGAEKEMKGKMKVTFRTMRYKGLEDDGKVLGSRENHRFRSQLKEYRCSASGQFK